MIFLKNLKESQKRGEMFFGGEVEMSRSVFLIQLCHSLKLPAENDRQRKNPAKAKDFVSAASAVFFTIFYSFGNWPTSSGKSKFFSMKYLRSKSSCVTTTRIVACTAR